jgi:putative ABC transport system substrate-binding protein
MKRRDFIVLLAGATLTGAWPGAAQAQQAMPVVGFLRSSPAAPFAHIVKAFRQGLNETGLVEGHNVTIEQRWADNHPDRLPALAADLVRNRAAVIAGNSLAIDAARRASATTPLVFVVGDDPVKMGYVKSLSRPGGNLTGVTFFGGGQLGAKRLELLRALVPKATVIAVLLDPEYVGFQVELPAVEAAAHTLGMRIFAVKLASDRGLDATFAKIVQTGASAILLGGGPSLRSKRLEIVATAARHAMPTIYDLRDYVDVGGLISYAASITGAYRQAGVYAGRILKGAKPAELPVLQPTKFELVINLKTAKALGLAVPPSLLATADAVIE